MHKKGFSLAAALVAMLSACSLASAQEIYVGAAAGNLKTQGILDACGKIEAVTTITPQAVTITNPVDSCPNSVSSMRLRGGVQANDNFSVEGFYAYTQDMDFKARRVSTGLSNNRSLTVHVSGDLEYHTFGLVVNGRAHLLPTVLPGFYGFARVGLHMWEQSAKLNSTNDPPGFPTLAEDTRDMLQGDGSDVIIGGGFQYLISDRATLELGYEDLNGDVFADTTSYYLGASYSF